MKLPPTPASPRRPRRIWIFLLGFVLGIAVLLGLLLAPPVQGWLARRIIATQSGWKLEFERIGVGPTGLDARGLEFAMPGVSASSAPVAIRVAPGRLLSKRELHVERVEARKIRVVLTPAQLAPSNPNEPVAPFEGVLALLRSPLPWALDAAHLDGEIVVRDGGESRLTGNFSLRGGGISQASPGEFAYELTAVSMILPPGEKNKFTSTGTIRVEQTPSHGVARIAVEGDLRLPHYGQFSLEPGKLKLVVDSTPTGENYLARVDFGLAGEIELNATLDASSILTGRAVLHSNQTIAASVAGENLPQVKMEGVLTFKADLESGDLDADISGDLDATAWEKLMAELAPIGAFKGRLVASLQKRADKLNLKNFTASLRSEKSPAGATLVLNQPVDLLHLPESPLASLKLAHWPVEWANPFLKDSGVQLSPGEFSASWTVAKVGELVRLTADQPASVAPLIFEGKDLPLLPSWQILFGSQVDISAENVTFKTEDFNITSAKGDRLNVDALVTYELKSGLTKFTGKLKGGLPSLLGLTEEKALGLESSWAASTTGNRLQVQAFNFSVGKFASASPSLALSSEKPFEFDLDTSEFISAGRSSELIRLRFNEFPLDWITRWLPGQTVAGTVVSGESLLRSYIENSVEMVTLNPWKIAGLAVGTTGATPDFGGDVQLAPWVISGANELGVSLKDIEVIDQKRNRLTGYTSVAVTFSSKEVKGDISLDAVLPALPQSENAFGELRARLRTKFHSMTPRIMGVDEFALQVGNASGDLLTFDAPLPFVAGLSDTDMVVFSTLAPLRMKTPGFPLKWLQPWIEDTTVDGALGPLEITLAAVINKYSVRAVSPLKIENLSVHRGGQELFRDAAFSAEPGLDLTFIAITKPKFQMVYTGTAHLTGINLDVAGKRAVDAELALGFKGNDTTTLPDLINFSSRVDFAAISNGAKLGLPAQGTLVTRINGELLDKQQPVELWARVAGLPTSDSKEKLPPLEVTLRGQISRESVFSGGVEMLLAAKPTPTDAAFDVKLNLVNGGLDITSGLRSKFIDGAALMELARAFPATPPAPVTTSAVTTTASPSAETHRKVAPNLPFWAALSGSYDLNIDAFQFAPYRIDRVRGRLDATRESLLLHDLGGEMFAGKWGGQLKIEHDPAVTTGEHTLAGEFRIEQFESARVVQTVFPNQLASVDAKINVRADVVSHGDSFIKLIDQSSAQFSVDGEKGVIRLSVPKGELVSTAAVFGGTVLLSPELRALGRLLRKFSEMPVDQIRISGKRDPNGDVTLSEFRFDSPQARLTGRGRIVPEGEEPLMNRPLSLSLELAAKDELAVILGGMSLLEKKPGTDGYRAMRQPFVLGGRAGAPDTAPLYDLLARAVSGSSGTWGFLMRKVQAEINKKQPIAAKSVP